MNSDTKLRSIEWHTSDGLVNYEDSLAAMEARVTAIRNGTEPELIWFLEHPPLYTAGTSASDDELLEGNRFPVYHVGRGGRYTYHGPGQRVAYLMLDLHKWGPKGQGDVRGFVRNLEAWVIDTLAQFGVTGERREGRVGIWVAQNESSHGHHEDLRDEKIAAIGIRVRHWISFHGIALNVNPDLSHYDGIMPCGIAEHGVTSLSELGVECTMTDVDAALMSSFKKISLRKNG